VAEAARPALAREGTCLYYLPAYSPERSRVEPAFRQAKRHDIPVRSHGGKAKLRQAVENGPEADRQRPRQERYNQPRLAAWPPSVGAPAGRKTS
jgi:transposase